MLLIDFRPFAVIHDFSIHVLIVATTFSSTTSYNGFQCDSRKEPQTKTNETTNNVHFGNSIHTYRNRSLREGNWRVI